MLNTVPDNSEIIMCEICLNEIPRSVSSSEGQDYVYHFCGLACYARWAGQLSAGNAAAKEGVTEGRAQVL